MLEWRPKERSPSLAPGPFVFFTLFAGRLAEPARRVAGNPSVEGCPTLSHEICMREMTRGLRGQFGSYESVTRSLLSPLREVLVGRASRSSGRARFLCGRPRRVAAKLPQLGAAVRRAACTRGRRADVLDAARARARHRAAQFSPWTFLLLRRMVSCINMATLLLPHGLPIAAACSCTTCRRVCGDATDVMHGLHSTVFFVQCCGLMMASCSACMSTCCTIGMCVEAFDACCSDRAADAGARQTGPCASGAGASPRASSSPPAGPTCCGGPAGSCLRAATSSSSTVRATAQTRRSRRARAD